MSDRAPDRALLPDPARLDWPRRSPRGLVRLVGLDDVDAIWAYRSDPEVVRHLSHGVLDRAGVVERLRLRLTDGRPVAPGADRVVRGVVLEVGGTVVGDGMLRVVTEGGGAPRLWIGYALARSAWGQGLGTELAQVLAGVGRELGLPVWADAYAENPASCRVLEKTGLVRVATATDEGRARHVFTDDPRHLTDRST
ncbi:GNAT family N-acetyltransferase [Phycicoccus flavus]|uniref:GNAT family N-acetyltransferase n=1 Tax=Phycicoccus flavus TaxID=2502783 RepID=UPI000FEC0686|nr:GNAT family N-acetyltransferase [Phycicoccus flavus]NHA68846.1 GNAT family N-acetyltransferase [Phycicoccus flavus]